jgi:hypothetical protein
VNRNFFSPRIFLLATGALAFHFLILSSANGQTGKVNSNEWATIEKLLNTQVEKWNEGDIDGFMQTYWNSPELTFSGGGKTTRGWQATMDRYKSRYPDRETMGTLEFDNLEHKSLGDNAALVLGSWQLTTAKGNPHGNFSLVLQKIEGKWLIIHDHSSTDESQE